MIRIYCYVIFYQQIRLHVFGMYYKRCNFKNDLNFINGINFGEDYYWMVGVLRACDSITYCDVVGYNYVRYNTKSYTSTIKDEYIWFNFNFK